MKDMSQLNIIKRRLISTKAKDQVNTVYVWNWQVDTFPRIFEYV